MAPNAVFESFPVIGDNTLTEVNDQPPATINQTPAVNNPPQAAINQPQQTPINYFELYTVQQSQLNQVSTELAQTIQERDNLSKILDRRTMEIERLELDSKQLSQQLQESINAKCEAVRQLEAIQYRVTEAEFKEKRFKHERTLAQQQIEMLTADLKKNIEELQSFRKESTTRIMNLEGKLNEKSSELEVSIRNEAQLKEANQLLTMKVEELKAEILKINEEFSMTMKKYQQELTSKSRLVELFKEKSVDELNVQRDVTDIVSELKASLKEATYEYGILETAFKQHNIQHQIEIEEQTKLIDDLKHELLNANQLLQAAKLENLEIAVEKLCPSAVKHLKLSKSGHSITEFYSMYVNATEELDVLNLEHEKLKETFTAVVHEIEENAPEIHRIKAELRSLRGAYETLSAKYQGCQAMDVIEGETLSNNEEADNNVELVDLIRELAAMIHKVDESKGDSVIEQLSNQVDQLKSQLSTTLATNFKLHAEIEHKESQLKIQQKNFDMTNKKLQSLEDKNLNSAIKIAKLETSLSHVRDQLDDCASKLSVSELLTLHLTNENKNLEVMQAQLKAENEMYNAQLHIQTQMMNRLESIEAGLENAKMMSENSENEHKFEDFKAQASARIEELETENQRLQDELTAANQRDNDSVQDYLSCAGSSASLDISLTPSEIAELGNALDFTEVEEPQLAGQKRQREDDQSHEDAIGRLIDEVIADKRFKIDEIEETEDAEDTGSDIEDVEDSEDETEDTEDLEDETEDDEDIGSETEDVEDSGDEIEDIEDSGDETEDAEDTGSELDDADDLEDEIEDADDLEDQIEDDGDFGDEIEQQNEAENQSEDIQDIYDTLTLSVDSNIEEIDDHVENYEENSQVEEHFEEIFENNFFETSINYFELYTYLQSQLNQVSSELAQSIQERDNLSKILDLRTMEIERLEINSKQLSQQLQESINAKCEAVRQLEAIQYRVTEAEFKEKRFKHERTLAQEQIEMLTADLNAFKEENELLIIEIEELSDEIEIIKESTDDKCVKLGNAYEQRDIQMKSDIVTIEEALEGIRMICESRNSVVEDDESAEDEMERLIDEVIAEVEDVEDAEDIGSEIQDPYDLGDESEGEIDFGEPVEDDGCMVQATPMQLFEPVPVFDNITLSEVNDQPPATINQIPTVNNPPPAVINQTPATINQPQESLFNYYEIYTVFESQLNQVSSELAQCIQERDNLYNILDLRTMEIERLELDSKQLSQQLQESINAKCEAVRQFEAIQYRMTEAEFKEKRFIHQRTLAQNQIEMLTADLKKTIQELQRCRKESAATITSLENNLNEKSSELEMSVRNEAQLKEDNELLTMKVEELSAEIVRINDLKESTNEEYVTLETAVKQRDYQIKSALESIEAALKGVIMTCESTDYSCRDCKNFKKTIENDKRAYEELSASIEELESENRRLESDLTASNEKFEENTTILFDYLQKLNQENAELKQQMNNIDLDISLTDSELEDTESELDLSEDEVSQSSEDDESADDEIDRLIDEVIAEVEDVEDAEDFRSETQHAYDLGVESEGEVDFGEPVEDDKDIGSEIVDVDYFGNESEGDLDFGGEFEGHEDFGDAIPDDDEIVHE
ncbi:nucleoprotein TPR-like [Chironomus tepperi]|uniref:nucleoprotein TPR-like n=1 Tax=Chironomus tepperi TaxID=113505 RepID=UPI00391FA8DC